MDAAQRVRRTGIWVTVAVVLVGLVSMLPPAQGARSARFVAAGDFGARADTRTVLDGMAGAGATAALALGDLAYKDVTPETAWCSYVKQSFGEGFPFQLISGNHESLDVADGAINNYSSCLPNQVPGIAGTYGRQYTMDFPRTDPLVRVIAVSPLLTFEDGRRSFSVDSPEYRWLSDAIDSGRAAGARWTIVAAHIPCWSVGVYSCQSTGFYNLMLSKRVDLVLHGHEHHYSRTHQLASGVAGCSIVPTGSVDPDCIRDTDGSFTAGQGTVFATVGTGGIPLRTVNATDTEAGYFAAMSGSNTSPAYGYLDIDVQEQTLGARFITTSGGPYTDAFTISAPSGNRAPVASFTSTLSGLSVAVDGSASSDPDGSIASYAWSFGDGATASGPTASHAYATAGTYDVTLTVTDNLGTSSALTRAVTATSPGGQTLAADGFTRTVATGWGSAQTGGSYTVAGTASNYSVNGSEGQMAVTPGATRRALLTSLSSPSTDLTVALGHNGTLTGSGAYLSVRPRVRPDTSAYAAKVVVSAAGTARVSLTRLTATGAETTLASGTTSLGGVTGTARLQVRTTVSGSSPTTLRAKIWLEGTPEPSAWAVQATDSTTAVQGPGGVGLAAYLSSSATQGTVIRFDNLQAVAP